MVSEKSIRVSIPSDLHARAVAMSGKTGVTISHVVRMALSVWTGEVETYDFEQLVAAARLMDASRGRSKNEMSSAR